MTAPEGDHVAQTPPLRRDRVVQAWVATVGISQAGDVAWVVGLAWSAAQVGTPAQAGFVIGIGTLPRAALLLLGGALADRLDARRTMVATNLGRIAVLLVGAAVAMTAGVSIALLAGVAVVFGLFDALYQPASSTMPRQMVRIEDLSSTFAMFQLANRIAVFVGAPVGGFLVAYGDIQLVMLVDAASYLVISLLLAGWLRPRFPRELSRSASVLADLRGGFRYLWETQHVRTLVVALSGLNLCVGPVVAVGLVLRTQDAGWSAPSLGFFQACIGIGAAAGALVAIRWKPVRPARTGLLILVGQATALAVVGFGAYAVVVAAMLTVGVTAGLASAYLSGAFQAAIEPSYLGRMGSITALADDALMPVMMVAFGAFAGGVSLTLACVLVSIAFAALVLSSAWKPGIDVAPAPATEAEVTQASR